MAPPNWSKTAAFIRAEIAKQIKAQAQVDELLSPQPVPYSHRSNILLGFPGFLDWLHDFAGGHISDLVYVMQHGSERDSRWVVHREIERYRHAKRAYESWVTDLVDHRIWPSATGQAVLSEIATASKRTASVVPYHPQTEDDYNADVVADNVPDATSNGMPNLDSDGQPFRDKTGQPTGGSGTGKGSDVTIHFSPDLWGPFRSGRSTTSASPPAGPGTKPDEVFMHELVHACRDMRGVRYRLGVNRHYDNAEEYLAIVITNIYLSEKYNGKTDLRADHLGHTPLKNPDKFLNEAHINFKPRYLLESLRLNQFTLFDSLAQVNAKFNPVQQYNAERKAAQKQPATTGKGR